MRTIEPARILSTWTQCTRVMEDDFLRIGSGAGESPKIPWTEAVRVLTASSDAPGPPFPNYNSSQTSTKRQKPPRKLAAKLEGLTERTVHNDNSSDNTEERAAGEIETKPHRDEMSEQSSLGAIRAAASSGNADAWDPMSFDYHSTAFNSYTSGPGALMQSSLTDSSETRNITLFVDHIPNTITKEGLRNLFSRSGTVRRINIVKPRPGAHSSYGFVEYATVREAESAMQQFNNFDIGHGKHLIVKVSTSAKDRQKQKEDEAFLKTLNCVKKSGGSTSLFDKEDYELNKEELEKCEENPLVPRYIPHPNSSPERPTPAVSGSLSPTKTVLTSSDGAASLRAPSSFTVPHVRGDSNSPPSKESKSRATSTSSGSGKGGSKEQPCNVCQSPTASKCSRCKMPYCSATCQREDWPVHKSLCRSRTSEHRTTAIANEPSHPHVSEDNTPEQSSVLEESVEMKIAEDLDDDGFHVSSKYDDEEELQSLQTLLQNVRAGKVPPSELIKPSAFTSVRSAPQNISSPQSPDKPGLSLYGLDKSPSVSSSINTTDYPVHQSSSMPLKFPPSSTQQHVPLKSPPSTQQHVLLKSPPSTQQTLPLETPPSTQQSLPLKSPPSTQQHVLLKTPPSTQQTLPLETPPSTQPTLPLKSPISFEGEYNLFGNEIVLPLTVITSQLYNISKSLMSVPLHSPLPQKFTAIVTSITSCARFSAVVASVEVKHALKQLQDFGAEATCTYVEVSELTEGSKCGYKNPSGEFFRVIVRAIKDVSNVDVTLYDFGGHETLPASVLFQLPDEIVIIPSLRQRLSIQSVRSQNTVESCKFLLDLIQARPVIVKNCGTVKLKNNPRISFAVCEIESTDGRNISDAVARSRYVTVVDTASPNKSAGVIGGSSINSPPSNTVGSRQGGQYKLVHYASKVPFHNPPHGFFEIQPTVVISPNVIWAHVMHPHLVTLNRLQDDLNKRYQPVKNASYAPVQGEMCVAKFSQDQQYYRAEVLCVNHSGTVDVHYVDFGNRDTVMTTQLRHIDPVFLTFPKQALQFSIAGIHPANRSHNWSDNAVAFIKDRIMNRRVRVRIVSETPGCYLIDLLDPDSQTEQLLNNVMVSLGHAEAMNGGRTTPRIPTPSTPTGNLVGVSVNRKTPNAIELPNATSGKFNTFVSRGRSRQSEGPQTPPSIKSGSSSPAPVNQDTQFGTGRVSQTPPHKFGTSQLHTLNNSLVSPSLKSPTQMQLENRKKPPTTLTGFSAGLPNSHGSRVPALQNASSGSPSSPTRPVPWKRFGSPGAGEIQMPKELKECDVQHIQSPFENGKEKLLSSSSNTNQEKRLYSPKRSIQPVKLKLDQIVEVIVSHVIHPLKFWVQLADQTSLKERLHLLEMLNEARLIPIASPHAGELCLCRSTDNKVNRGRVMEISNKYATVEFIDYGNSEEISLDDICEIDSAIVEVPAQGVLCTVNYLLNPNGKGNPWDAKAIEFFKSKVCTESPITVKCAKVVGIMNVVDVNLATGEDMLQVMDQSGHGKAFRVRGKSNKGDVTQNKLSGSGCSPHPKAKSIGMLTSRGFSPESPNQNKTSPFSGFRNQPNVQDNTSANVNKRSPFSTSNSVQSKTKGGLSRDFEKTSKSTDTGSLTVRKDLSLLQSTAPLKLSPFTISKSVSPKYPSVASMKRSEISNSFQVLVSEVHSPDSIFFQTATQQTAIMLDSLSTDLNTYFQTTIPPVISQPPNNGSLVCAKFSKDQAWYRGEVLDSRDGVCKVRFIDYGNTDSVRLSDLSPCPSQFVSIPVLATECALNGIIPPGSSASWSPQATSFLKEKMTDCLLQANVVGSRERDGVLLVDLINNSEGIEVNMAQEMVSQGLALNKQPGPSRLQDVPSRQQSVQQAISSNVQLIQVSSLKKAELPSDSRQLQVLVSEVHSPDSIFFQTATQQTAIMLDSLSTDLNTYFQTTIPPVISQPPNNGSLVCAKFSKDQAWYRGEVLDSCDGVCKVRFIDYGNTDSVQFSDLSPCPSQFVSIPAIAVECSLNGVLPLNSSSSWTADSRATLQLKQLCLDQVVQAKVISFKTKGPLLVDLFATVNGVEVNIASELIKRGVAKSSSHQRPTQDPLVEVPTVKLPTDTSLKVLVSDCGSPSSVWLQLYDKDQALALHNMMNKLQEVYRNPSKYANVVAQVGKVYCSKYADDDCWYRCRVTRVSGKKVTVEYIDFGNSATLSLNQLFSLDPNFAKLPGQAVECTLSGIKPLASQSSWTRECAEKLKSLVSGTQFFTAVIVKSSSQDSKPFIELYLDDESTQSVADLLVQSGLASLTDILSAPKFSSPFPCSNVDSSPQVTSSTSRQLPIPLPLVTLPSAARFPVLITEITTLAEIYIQIANKQSLEVQLKMMEALNSYSSSTPNCTEFPAVGELCVAQYSDGSWFRAQVIQHLENNTACEVFFFDFGNKELVELDKLKPISKQLLQWPIQSVKCGMYGVPAKEVLKPMSSDEVFLFKSLLSSPDVSQCIVINKDPLFVDFESTGGLSIRDEYIRKGLFPQVGDLGMTSLVGNQLSTTDTEMVIVTEKAGGPSDFWVQVVDRVSMQEFEKLTEQIQDYCMRSSPLAQPLVLGQLCCAKFSQDGMWYRARVVELLGESTVKVLFVDFGNIERTKVSNLRPVNRVFMHFPAQAVHCCLIGHTVQKEEMGEKFSSLVNERVLIAANRGKRGLYKTVVELADTSTSQDVYIHKQLQ